MTPESMGWDPKAGQYVLPPLPYKYEDLEPHIDAETMHLHHDKHHKAYVDGLNKAQAMLGEIRANKRDNHSNAAWHSYSSDAGDKRRILRPYHADADLTRFAGGA